MSIPVNPSFIDLSLKPRVKPEFEHAITTCTGLFLMSGVTGDTSKNSTSSASPAEENSLREPQLVVPRGWWRNPADELHLLTQDPVLGPSTDKEIISKSIASDKGLAVTGWRDSEPSSGTAIGTGTVQPGGRSGFFNNPIPTTEERERILQGVNMPTPVPAGPATSGGTMGPQTPAASSGTAGSSTGTVQPGGRSGFFNNPIPTTEERERMLQGVNMPTPVPAGPATSGGTMGPQTPAASSGTAGSSTGTVQPGGRSGFFNNPIPTTEERERMLQGVNMPTPVPAGPATSGGTMGPQTPAAKDDNIKPPKGGDVTAPVPPKRSNRRYYRF